jgi:hypothetical protein
MKARSLLILFLVSLGMGTYLYYGVQKPSEEKEARAEFENKLAQGDLKLLKEVEVLNSRGKFKLENVDKIWRVKSEQNDIASLSKIKTLISGLKDFEEKKIIFEKLEGDIPNKKLNLYGLQVPALSLSYKTGGQKEAQLIELGKENPHSSGVYARLNKENKILLTSINLDFLKDQTGADYREMRLSSPSSSDYDEVSIAHKGKITKFKVTEDSSWKMISPYELPLDKTFTKGIIDKINLIRANEFISDNTALKKAVSSTPDIKILIGFKENIRDQRSTPADPRPEGTEILLKKIKKAKGESYYALSDKAPLASIAKFHFENFAKDPRDFIQKTFLHIVPSDISSISIQSPNKGALEIKKELVGYSFLNEASAKTPDNTAVTAALNSLRNLKAHSFDSLFTKAPSKFDLKLRLQSTEGSVDEFYLKKGSKNDILWHSNGNLKMKYILKTNALPADLFSLEKLEKKVKKNELKLPKETGTAKVENND